MTAPDNPPDQRPAPPLEQRAQAIYHEACQRIDPVAISRLRDARRQALQAAQQPYRHARRWLLPTGALMVAAFAVMTIWQPLPRSAAESPQQAFSLSAQNAMLDDDLPPDAEKADPSLYQNLDFYGWLAANENRPENH